jgi:hypothetical protein
MRCDHEGVPILSKAQYEDYGELILGEHCPFVFDFPSATPIEEVAEDDGREFLQYRRLSPNLDFFAAYCYSDQEFNIYDNCGQAMPIKVAAGTILIDPAAFWDRNIGNIRFSIAHELVHKKIHPSFFIVQESKGTAKAKAFRCPDKLHTLSKPEQFLEYQANGIAACILMPKKTFFEKARSVICECKRDPVNGQNMRRIVQDVAHRLGRVYNVSAEAAARRLDTLDLLREIA